MTTPNRATLIFVAVALAIAGTAVITMPWQQAPAGQLERHQDLYATALTANVRILGAGSSATTALRDWCADHRLADPATITTYTVDSPSKPVTPAQRTLLGVASDEPVGYRHVRLMCGAALLSKVEYWYVPARLTPEMRDRLRTDPDAPFTEVIAPLLPYRHALTNQWLWHGLPPMWTRQAPAALRGYVAEHTDELTPDPQRRLFAMTTMLQRNGDNAPYDDGAAIAVAEEAYHWDLIGFRLR